ncbi:MAG: cupredoxin domain-containing protein [Polyangiales bacterium]
MSNALFAGAAALAVALMVAPVADADSNEGVAATVSMTGKSTFSPETIEIKAGDTVLWKNDSTKVHTVTADPRLAKDPKNVELPSGVAPFDSGKIKPGGTYRHTFTTPGHYTYFCTPHEKVVMVGHITVRK